MSSAFPVPDEPNAPQFIQTQLAQAEIAQQKTNTQPREELSINEGEIGNPESAPADEQENLDVQSQVDDIEISGAIFQAVGIITGEVKFGEDNKSTVTIGRHQYDLLYARHKLRVFQALKKEIEITGNAFQRLVVYPKVIHFPKKEQQHRMSFQLVGFDKGRFKETVSGELEDLEFKLSGLWQFIPVCSTPCISVFRNYSRERLEYIKQSSLAQKVRYMKASHIPLLWKDALLRPFRFNPKAAKEEQGKRAFVSLKARFLPGRDVFGFVALTALPQETAPRYLKASKQDKATVQQQVKKNQPKQQQPSKQDKLDGNKNTHKPQPKPIPKKKSQVSEKTVGK
ncbi:MULTISPECIES: hypothetical protein [Nostoc]|uniref:Uncharacterized protein n=1 Tax=Nostoc paludosum FACHB-159 TaxID=2692908 RepID=A0ABR8KQG7_9NOSO|nr:MULTISPECIES: hypothetical protein [Nostoc]MBD2683539.1 hypothetical protein [Nostoc sp. FACHB-857]MBD2739867.1 hypothetical protein [Nostoc paludosum FACHB-159]